MTPNDPPQDPTEPVQWPNPESATRGSQGAATRDFLRQTLPVRQPLRPGAVAVRQIAFPEEAELEYERSVIRIPFTLKGAARAAAKRDVDIMAFDAYMRIIREAPIRNGIGLRQFEFYIDAWELTNSYSSGLNKNITFTLSDTVQPKSICIARQREADFPAMIVYNGIYDIYLGRERIVQNQAGTAFATPVWEIPPRNVTVAFEKPFDSDTFSFAAGTCEGMTAIAAAEFERGAAQARAVRAQG
jgi:hypothetical protein